MDAAKPQKSKVKGIVIYFCIVGALGGLLFGLDQGFINGSLDFINRYWKLTTSGGESYASIMILGCVLGALISGWIAKSIGRKYTLVIAALFFTVFSFWGAVTESYEILYWTRFCLGLGVGSASCIVPMYLSEIAPTRVRGAMISLYQFFITIGIFGVYVSNAWIDSSFEATWHNDTWRLMLGFLGIPAIVMLILMFTIPRTPRFLILKKKDDEAKKVLKKTLATEEECIKELKEIKESLAQDEKLKSSGALRNLLGKSYFKKVLLLGIMIQLFVQPLTGINTIIYYSGIIFKSAGMSNPATGTILVGLTNVLATIIALVLIDKYGRKPLMYSGLILMIISLVINGTLFLYSSHGAFGQIALVVFTLLFIIGFAYSCGPIAWVICAEIFPLEGRDFAMTITSAVNWVGNYFVIRFSLTIMNSLGGSFLFYMFAVFCVIGLIIMKYFTPETKGVSLEKIEMNLKAGKRLKNIGI